MIQLPPNPFRRPDRRRRRAFTLVELLVVIGIIVLLMAVAVPLFSAFRGGRSIDGAENIISAMLQRTRARAIGMQERRGVFCYTDAATGNTNLVTVKVFDAPITVGSATIKTYIDVDPDADEPQPLPIGIGAAFIAGRDAAAGSTVYKKSGLIVFDGVGRIVPLPAYSIATGTHSQKLYEQYMRPTMGAATPPTDEPSQYGILLFDKEEFTAASTVGSEEYKYGAAQSTWLDQNGVALIVNRYNGTLFRGTE